MRIKITIYDGNLIFETNHSHPMPEGIDYRGKGGLILGELYFLKKKTVEIPRDFLGISVEALVVLRSLPLSADCVGDVSSRLGLISWIGGPNTYKPAANIQGDCNWDANSLIFTVIPNTFDSAAKKAIDADALSQDLGIMQLF